MSMTSKINKSEIPGGPLSFFDALFGRCTAFYGHFLIDVVTSEGSTRISPSKFSLELGFGAHFLHLPFTPAFLLMIPSNIFAFLFNHTRRVVRTLGGGGVGGVEPPTKFSK